MMFKEIKDEAEQRRIAFVLERDGEDEALLWAIRSMKNYRRAVLNKKHFASTRTYKKRYIAGYIELKRFVLSRN